MNKSLLRLCVQIGSLWGWVRGEDFLGVRLGLGYSSPDGLGDGGDGVGGEGGAPTGVVALKSLPKGDAAHVQGLGVGETPKPLAPHHPVH